MQFWALVIDSIRESLDRKIFWVMLVITLLIVLAMASIRFENDEVSILFGLWETEAGRFNPLSPVGRSALIGGVIYYVMSFFLGWVGLILTLAFLVLMMIEMIQPAVDKLTDHEVTMTLGINRFVHWIPIIFGFALSIVATVAVLVHYLRHGVPTSTPSEDISSE